MVYRKTGTTYANEMFCPSTKLGNFVNKSPEGYWGLLGISGSFILPIGIGLTIEVSAFFAFLFGIWIIALLYGIVWAANAYTMRARIYTHQVLPVEQAYARLSPTRQKQYRRLVAQAYKNIENNDSNQDIADLFNECIKLDDSGADNFVKSELETIRKTRADLAEWQKIES